MPRQTSPARPPVVLARSLLAAGVVLMAGCATTRPHTPREDADAVLALSHAEEHFRVAMRDFVRAQLERNPELRPYAGAIDTFWQSQLPWPDIRDRLADSYATLYSPEELRAIRHALERPLGDSVTGHSEVMDKQIGTQAMQALQERMPAFERHLQDLRNTAAAGDAGLLTPEQDFVATRQRAEAGDAAAQLLLAEKLLAGAGTARDVPQGIQWLEKSAAQDHAAALDTLSTLYYRGAGVPRDYRKARDLMERAAAKHYLPAINNLAWLLATCPEDGLRDGKRAVKLLGPVMDQSTQMLDTLAAAYAEAGNFREAVSLQRRAISNFENTGDPRFLAALDRLQAYAARQPWRDPRVHAEEANGDE